LADSHKHGQVHAWKYRTPTVTLEDLRITSRPDIHGANCQVFNSIFDEWAQCHGITFTFGSAQCDATFHDDFTSAVTNDADFNFDIDQCNDNKIRQPSADTAHCIDIRCGVGRVQMRPVLS
jgi:hypothetical protein